MLQKYFTNNTEKQIKEELHFFFNKKNSNKPINSVVEGGNSRMPDGFCHQAQKFLLSWQLLYNVAVFFQ